MKFFKHFFNKDAKYLNSGKLDKLKIMSKTQSHLIHTLTVSQKVKQN